MTTREGAYKYICNVEPPPPAIVPIVPPVIFAPQIWSDNPRMRYGYNQIVVKGWDTHDYTQPILSSKCYNNPDYGYAGIYTRGGREQLNMLYLSHHPVLPPGGTFAWGHSFQIWQVEPMIDEWPPDPPPLGTLIYEEGPLLYGASLSFDLSTFGSPTSIFVTLTGRDQWYFPWGEEHFHYGFFYVFP